MRRRAVCDRQSRLSFEIGIQPKTCVLRLMSGADDTSLRMRLVAQPGDLAADETWRVRLLASAGAKGLGVWNRSRSARMRRLATSRAT